MWSTAAVFGSVWNVSTASSTFTPSKTPPGIREHAFKSARSQSKAVGLVTVGRGSSVEEGDVSPVIHGKHPVTYLNGCGFAYISISTHINILNMRQYPNVHVETELVAGAALTRPTLHSDFRLQLFTPVIMASNAIFRRTTAAPPPSPARRVSGGARHSPSAGGRPPPHRPLVR